MKGFLVRLTDEQRERLEAYRARHGLRSGSEAIRHMIDGVIHADHAMKPPRQWGQLAQGAPSTPSGEKALFAARLGPEPSKPGSRLKKR